MDSFNISSPISTEEKSKVSLTKVLSSAKMLSDDFWIEAPFKLIKTDDPSLELYEDNFANLIAKSLAPDPKHISASIAFHIAVSFTLDTMVSERYMDTSLGREVYTIFHVHKWAPTDEQFEEVMEMTTKTMNTKLNILLNKKEDVSFEDVLACLAKLLQNNASLIFQFIEFSNKNIDALQSEADSGNIHLISMYKIYSIYMEQLAKFTFSKSNDN